MTRFDWNRARDTARRLREGKSGVPLIERERPKHPGDLVISSTRVERIGVADRAGPVSPQAAARLGHAGTIPCAGPNQ